MYQEERGTTRRSDSPDDIERYKAIKEQHERMEEERRKHALKVRYGTGVGFIVSFLLFFCCGQERFRITNAIFIRYGTVGKDSKVRYR